MLAQIFAVIAPVFACAGIGYGWSRSGRSYDTEMVTTLMVVFATPCLVFSTLVHADLTLEALFAMAGFAVPAIGGAALIGAVALRMAGLSMRAFLPSLMFANTGNMGLPLCLLAFGDEGLALAIAFFTVAALGQFIAGPALAAGTFSARELVRNPIIYAVVLGSTCLIAGIRPPDWIDNTVRIIGAMTIPMMLITLGVSLGRLRVASLTRSLWLSVLRLVMGFAIGWALAEAFELEGAMRGVLILESAMPVAVFNYLFAQRYNARPEEVAGMVVISTALSLATLPALIWYVLP